MGSKTPAPERTMTDIYNEGTAFQKDYQALLRKYKTPEARAAVEQDMVEWRRALGQEPRPEDVWDYELGVDDA